MHTAVGRAYAGRILVQVASGGSILRALSVEWGSEGELLHVIGAAVEVQIAASLFQDFAQGRVLDRDVGLVVAVAPKDLIEISHG